MIHFALKTIITFIGAISTKKWSKDKVANTFENGVFKKLRDTNNQALSKIEK